MEDDLRFVHREETFKDLAVRELAKTRSACICRIQFGRCTQNECKHCAVNQRYKSCYNELSDYDKQRLLSYTAERWVQDSATPEHWATFPRVFIYLFLKPFFIVGVIILLLWICFCSFPTEQPKYTVPVERSEQIIATIKEAQSKVKDINADGEINCIDYAITYKLVWDNKFPGKEYQCLILRNYNPTNGFHHLFIAMQDDNNNFIFVEPWAKNPYIYNMEDNWKNGRYNPKFNLYSETVKWLNTVKKEL